MTEVGWISTTDPCAPPEETVGSVGRPYTWMGVRVIDDAGHSVSAGVEGEVIVGGPCVCVGYYRNPERNEASFMQDGSFRTGDVGLIDEAGQLRLVGRTKDLIKHGGASVFPRELEEILYQHPKIAEIAVIGVPDPYFGENACACVVPRPGETVDLAEIVTFMRDRIATYKLPQRLEVMDELPHTSTGKVQKHRLRELVVSRPAAEPAVPTSRRAS
jgi:acyl-CoA synthetase (AMP-forming)/AMP-acid ligase II